jgi:hypothetical protein
MIGVLGFDSRRRLGIFLFTTLSRTALGPTQPPIQWIPGVLFLGVKWPGRETDHSPPFSAEVKELVELYLHSPNTSSWRGAQLKHRNNCTFNFTNLRFLSEPCRYPCHPGNTIGIGYTLVCIDLLCTGVQLKIGNKRCHRSSSYRGTKDVRDLLTAGDGRDVINHTNRYLYKIDESVCGVEPKGVHHPTSYFKSVTAS